MNKIKKVLFLPMVVIVLSAIAFVGAFAGYEAIETVYEKGNTYSINGVDYFIEENGSVTVKGPALKGVPERVEILSKLGDYTVTSIGNGAFYNCKTVKEAVIPETVTLIDSLAFKKSGLTDIEIKGRNVDISTNFRDTPLWSDNIANDTNMLVVSGYAVDAFSRGELVLGEDIVGISKDCFRYGSGAVTKITILNPDCHIFDFDGVLPPNAIVYGYKDSTAQQYALNHGYRFSTLCNCDDRVFIPTSSSRCDGTVGYAEGYWCEKCEIYASGGLIDTSFEHKDSDGDNICDLCNNGTDSEITTAGQCGDEAVWTLSDDGVLRIIGTSSVYSYSATNREPWYNQRHKIKAFVSEKGIEGLRGISFEGYQNLRSAEMAEALSVPKSFRGCTALNNVKLPRYARIIPSMCFRSCTSLERLFIPKNIIEIQYNAFLDCSELRDIDFETGYLSLQKDAFYGTAAYNNPDNIKDGLLYIDNCLIAEITPGAVGIVLGAEITSIASWWSSIDTKVEEITVYNYDCAFPNDTGALPGGAHLKGYVGSTAWFYSKKDFVPLEAHIHTEIIDIPAVAPTAAEVGFTHYSHCAVCEEVVSTREIISPLEYDIAVADDVITARRINAATIEADGYNTIITFESRHDVYTSDITRTVIYKVGEVKLSETRLIYNGSVQQPDVSVKDSRGKALTLGKDYKVTYSDNSKYCGKYSVRVDYIGNYAGNKLLDYKIVIDAIEAEVSAVNTKSITLSWEKGHSDLVYRVYLVDSNGELIKIADTKNGSYEITDLEPSREYSFRVRGYVKDDKGNTYWGEKGDTIICETGTEITMKGLISLIRNFIAKIRIILKIFFA